MDTTLITAAQSSDMDTAKIWINFAANICLTSFMSAFFIFLFGRDNSTVYNMPGYKILILKLGLAMCAAGALFNAGTLNNPTWGETILNSGFCALFGWSAWFHYKLFVKPWQEQETAKRLEEVIKASKSKRKAPRKIAAK
jgi:hypothetical protein